MTDLDRLIRGARTDIADADRCITLGISPAARQLHRRLREVTNYIESLRNEIESLRDRGDQSGPRAGTTVLLPEGLDDLPLYSIVIDDMDDAFQLQTDTLGCAHWYMAGAEIAESTDAMDFPVRIVHRGPDSNATPYPDPRVKIWT